MDCERCGVPAGCFRWAWAYGQEAGEGQGVVVVCQRCHETVLRVLRGGGAKGMIKITGEAK